jgi:hypothetical protein
LAAGADAPAVAGVTSVNAVESPEPSAVAGEIADPSSPAISAANKAVQPSGAAIQAGADKPFVSSGGATDVPIASGVTSAQATVETAAGAVAGDICIDDPLQPTTPGISPEYKWNMTGPVCSPRTNVSTAPRYVAYWSQ